MLFKLWIKQKKNIIPISGIFLFLLSLVNCFFSLLTILWINNYQYGFVIIEPTSGQKTLAIIELTLNFVAMGMFAIVFIFRLVSSSFKVKCFKKPTYFLIATLFLLISCTMLISFYKTIFDHEYLTIGAQYPSDEVKSFVGQFNLLRWTYLVKTIILATACGWILVYSFSLVSDETIIKWIAQDINLKGIKREARKERKK